MPGCEPRLTTGAPSGVGSVICMNSPSRMRRALARSAQPATHPHGEARVWEGEALRVSLPALASLLVLLFATGCNAGAPPKAEPSIKVGGLVERLGAESLVVMAGDEVMRAGLAEIDIASERLVPLVLEPDPMLISNVSGNGERVVLGAAGVPDSGSKTPGTLSDGVYEIAQTRLLTIAGPEKGLRGPTMSPSGALAAIRADGGFAVKRAGTRAWRVDRRHPRTTLSSPVWVRNGDLVTVIDAHKSSAKLLLLGSRGGERGLGDAFCASGVLAAPDGAKVVTVPSFRTGARNEHAGCNSGHVIAVTGNRPKSAVPAGWRPLAWSRDSAAILVSRGHEMGVWPLDGPVRSRTDVGVSTWMAAPIYG